MIFHLRIDRPNIVLAQDTANDVIHSRHGGQHRVILIVVLVHPVTADQVEIMETVKIFPDYVKSVVSSEIGGISLRNAHHMGIAHVASPQNPNLLDLSDSKLL